MANLPTNPLTGTTGPFSLPFIQTATNIANSQGQTGAPYSTAYLQSIGILPPDNSGSTTGTTGSSGTATAPVDTAAYDQAIANTQAAINNLPNQLNSGNANIDTSYQDALNQLLAGKNQANSAYTTNKGQDATQYVAGKNTIGANAGNSLNGLLRLLGSRGAGGSSAATITAPGAVAQQATIQRGDLGNTFATNESGLDTNWNNYLTGYNNQVSSAGSQRDQQKQQLQASVNTNQASLLQSIATLAAQKSQAAGGDGVAAAQPYLDQANSLLSSAATNPTFAPISYQTQAYQSPNLASYTTNPNAAPTFNGSTASTDYVSPYLSALVGKKQPSGVTA